MKGSIGAYCLTWACHNADMALWKGNHAVFPKDIKNFRCYDDVKNIPNFIICFLLICFISWKISTITINIADISKNKPFVRISGFVVDTAQNPHFLACVVVNSLPVTNKSWTSPKFKAYGNLVNTVHQSVSKVGKKDRLFCIILFSGHQAYSPLIKQDCRWCCYIHPLRNYFLVPLLFVVHTSRTLDLSDICVYKLKY